MLNLQSYVSDIHVGRGQRVKPGNVRAVRTESWKYTHYPHGDGGPDRHKAELYNIEFDPEERHNLIDNPKYGGVVKQMQAERVLF